ncbi:MAG: macro domain-containing protein [Duncaniella sp.]|nr:macro domain-containing protein [Duncaniella sp.]
MIINVKGDLLKSNAQALVNTVNTVGVMGKGIALQFREEFPENYRIYRDACKRKELEIGKLLITEENTPAHGEKIIVNFPTKTHWRYPSDYSYIEKGLVTLREEIIARDIRSIAIPPLGSRNGGLDWLKVKDMIVELLADLDCEIYLYEPSEIIIERMKSERVKLTPARAMLITLMADMNRHGEFASVFAAEKLVYFMQRFGGKDFFKIEFRPYVYGPYSGGKVAHVLYHMNGSYIKGMGGMQNRPFDYIWLVDDAEKEALDYISNLADDKARTVCDRTMRFLRSFYSNYTLELLSSVDFLLHSVPTLKGWRDMDNDIVIDHLRSCLHDWSSRKEAMFNTTYLEIAVNYLKNTPDLL